MSYRGSIWWRSSHVRPDIRLVIILIFIIIIIIIVIIMIIMIVTIVKHR